jgi:hypothetical protein
LRVIHASAAGCAEDKPAADVGDYLGLVAFSAPGVAAVPSSVAGGAFIFDFLALAGLASGVGGVAGVAASAGVAGVAGVAAVPVAGSAGVAGVAGVAAVAGVAGVAEGVPAG